MDTLTEVGKRNFTEKANIGFLDIYEDLWKDKFSREAPITLLEIGVYNGNSMRTWCEWFPNAVIIGIDKHTAPRANESRATIYRGDQSDEDFLTDIGIKLGEIDIIIDDGGHHWGEQQISFETLWRFVSKGGMYIIEDLETSGDLFWKSDGFMPTINYLHALVQQKVVYCERQDIHSISFYEKLAVINKPV